MSIPSLTSPSGRYGAMPPIRRQSAERFNQFTAVLERNRDNISGHNGLWGGQKSRDAVIAQARDYARRAERDGGGPVLVYQLIGVVESRSVSEPVERKVVLMTEYRTRDGGKVVVAFDTGKTTAFAPLVGVWYAATGGTSDLRYSHDGRVFQNKEHPGDIVWPEARTVTKVDFYPIEAQS